MVGPELKVTQGGKDILSFSIPSNARVNKEKHTDWIRCTIFGERAKALAGILTDGKIVAVRGQLTGREYEGRNGKGFSLDCIVDDVDILGDGGKRDDSGEKYGKSGAGNSAKHTAGSDEDIPF